MTLTQTPIIRDADAGKNLYRGVAMSQMAILKDYMQTAGINTYTRITQLANGVVITCQKSFEREDIYINVPPQAPETLEVINTVMVGSFVFVPRMFGVNDGYHYVNNKLVADGDGSVEYPLVNTAAIGYRAAENPPTRKFISSDPHNDPLKAKAVAYRANLVFGNVDWIGKNTAPEGKPSNAPVLTWKGPTGRTIPFDFTKPISGLTTDDIKFGDTDYYTCFGAEIYAAGSVLDSLPLAGDVTPKVLGAAYTTYVDAKEQKQTTLVCVVNNHYVDKLGFFDEVWVKYKEWEMIYSAESGRPTQCWFFNQSGTKCTRNNYELSIDCAAKVVTQVVHDLGTGAYNGAIVSTNTNAGVTPPTLNTGGMAGDVVQESSAITTITHSGSYHLYSDYKGDLRVTAVVNVSDKSVRSFKDKRTWFYEDIQWYKEGPQPDMVVVGPDAFTPGAYTAIGGQGTITILEPDPSGCGMKDVVATDSCGRTARKSVRMASGRWVTLASGDSCPGGSLYYLTSGATRTLSYVVSDGFGDSPTNGHRDQPTPGAPFNYGGTWDAPGMLITCGSCSTHYVTSTGTLTCGGGSCLFFSGGGVQWTDVLIYACYGGMEQWVC